jgi:hypothetical protein
MTYINDLVAFNITEVDINGLVAFNMPDLA